MRTVTQENVGGWMLVAILFALFDSFATYVNLVLGNIVEGNGLIQALINNWGPESALFARGVAVSSLIILLTLISITNRRAERGLRAVTFVLGLVALYHLAGPSLVAAVG